MTTGSGDLKVSPKVVAPIRQARQPRRDKQPVLDFGDLEGVSPSPLPAQLMPVPVEAEVEAARRERSRLLPVRHVDRDFFLCDMFDYAMKDDGVSMEAPIFTLATKADLSVWRWESKDGNRAVTVTPSVQGRATQFDKDVLIYVVSQMTEAPNRERLDAKNRVVRFTVYDYLVSTNKPTGGKEYSASMRHFSVCGAPRSRPTSRREAGASRKASG